MQDSIRSNKSSLARRVTACLLSLVVTGEWSDLPARAEPAADDLTELSLEELMNVAVTSVSRKPESQMGAAAAIFVITQEAIRRSGVTSIPEALRLAPGLQVSRVDSSHWAVGARGFTSTLSRSLLVLIDGRSVYSPLFAGTFWDVQDVLLEDIERIEVIRGPGGTLWGANAVNGVINIITKHSKDSQGNLAVVGGGTQERGFTAYRHGGKIGKDFNYRFYGKFFDRTAEAQPEFDGWRKGQGGFRTDWTMSPADSLTVQGDIYAGRAGQSVDLSSFTPPFLQTVRGDADLNGGNVLSRWRHTFSASSDMSLQLYYDRTARTQPNFREFRDTFDLDFQHHFRLSSRHDFMWGFGYRLTSGLTRGIPTQMFQPAQRSDNLYSAFGQYELAVIPEQVRLIVGMKVQHNDYSGFEFQPNGRIVWTPNARHTVWGAISRAVRTPSRIEHDLTLYQNAIPGFPAFAKVLPNQNFASEKVIAYELGYRMQPTDRLFLDIAGFYNSYTDLLSAEIIGPAALEATPSPLHIILPLMFANRLHGEVLGMEVASTWQILTWWRLRGSYSFLKLNLTANADSNDTVNAPKTEESSPSHQFSFQSTMDLPGKIEFDLTPRVVSALSGQNVPNYYAIDARLGWHPTSNMEIAFIGRNLTGQHPEFSGDNNGLTNIQRGLYAKATWRW